MRRSKVAKRRTYTHRRQHTLNWNTTDDGAIPIARIGSTHSDAGGYRGVRRWKESERNRAGARRRRNEENRMQEAARRSKERETANKAQPPKRKQKCTDKEQKQSRKG